MKNKKSTKREKRCTGTPGISAQQNFTNERCNSSNVKRTRNDTSTGFNAIAADNEGIVGRTNDGCPRAIAGVVAYELQEHISAINISQAVVRLFCRAIRRNYYDTDQTTILTNLLHRA